MGQVDGVAHGRVLVIRLTGGGANALDREMAGQLHDLVAEAATREDIGAVLVTGGFGGAFCAGSNIKELTELRDAGDGPGPLLRAEARAMEALAALDKPTVAAIEGPAMGGGLELALCCDLIVAAEDARIGLPEIKIGVFPALGGTVRLQKRIGEGRARELLLLGDEIDGVTAGSWGLANRVEPEMQVYRTARSLADRLAAGPMAATAGIKASLRQAADEPEAQALVTALDTAEAHSTSDEVAEGFRSFETGEDPDFTKGYASEPVRNVTPLRRADPTRKAGTPR